jgi:U3 small nucleolar RNA-associated protein 3
MADRIRFDDGDAYEPTDSDEEYSDTEKELLKKVRSSRKHNEDSEEEVLGFDDQDSDESEDDDIEKFDHDSDIEGKESDDGLPDSKAWGSSRKSYHGADFVDQDYDTYTAKEEELAKQEEAEAKEIQQRLAKELDEADFSLDFFKPVEVEEQEKPIETTKLKVDVSDLSKRQQLTLFRKEAPEFEGLVEDFTTNVEECSTILEPMMEFFKSRELKSPVVDFVKLKYDLAMSYCNNITFYLLLKSKRTSVKNHPVVKRMVQLKQLLSKLDERYQELVRPQVGSSDGAN